MVLVEEKTRIIKCVRQQFYLIGATLLFYTNINGLVNASLRYKAIRKDKIIVNTSLYYFLRNALQQNQITRVRGLFVSQLL